MISLAAIARGRGGVLADLREGGGALRKKNAFRQAGAPALARGRARPPWPHPDPSARPGTVEGPARRCRPRASACDASSGALASTRTPRRDCAGQILARGVVVRGEDRAEAHVLLLLLLQNTTLGEQVARFRARRVHRVHRAGASRAISALSPARAVCGERHQRPRGESSPPCGR